MAQVPDVPAPNVVAQGTLQSNTIQTNPNAFGANIGGALEGAAQNVERASDTFEAQAKFQQALTNKADADQASIAFANQANQTRLDYTTNVKGAAATPDALKTAAQSLDDAREQIAQNLNPMAKQIYDEDSRRTAFNTTSQLAAHTAAEQHQYVKQSMTSLIDLKQAAFASDPTNPQAMQDFVDIVRKQYPVFQQMEGWDDNTAKLAEQKALSKGFIDSIESVSIKDPIAAQEMKDQAAKAGNLTADDNRVLDKYLHAVTKPYVANQMVEDLFNGHTGDTPSLTAIRTNPQAYFDTHLADGVTITSADRTPAGNAAVGGVANSNHLFNRAWDVVPGDADISMADLYAKAKGIPGANEVLLEKGNVVVSDPAQADHVHVGFKAEPNTAAKPLAFQNVDQIDEAWAGLQKQVIDNVNTQYGSDPDIKRAALQALDSRLGALRTGMNAQAQASTARISNIIIPDGSGKAVPTSLEQMFQSVPGAQNDYLNMTGAEQAGVLRQLNHNAHPTIGDMTPEQQSNYFALYGESRTNAAGFAQKSLMADPRYVDLPNAMKIQLGKEQANLRAGNPTNPAEQKAISAIKPLISQATDAFPTVNVNGSQKVDLMSPQYTTFMGQYLGLVRDYTDAHKTAPDADHMQKLAVTAMQQYKAGAPSLSMVPGVPEDFVHEFTKVRSVAGAPAFGDQDVINAYNSWKAKHGK